jgi:hypothetical protein
MKLSYCFIVVLLAICLLAACNKPQPADGTTSSAPAADAVASTPPADSAAAPAETEHSAAGAALPSSVQLSDGSSVSVIAASVVDGDPKAHAGLVAIAGEVSQVYADRGTFMIKDCPKDEDCKTTDSCSCCSSAEVPVRLSLSDYDGALPEVAQDVIVIAELQPTETGYTLAVREVRSGESTLLVRKA